MPKLNIPSEYISDYLDHLRKDFQKSGLSSQKSFHYTVGSTYIHVYVVDGSDDGIRSSHSWIVNKEGTPFPLGTILKSASWRGPSRNFARGNVLTKDFSRARWTGIS